MKRVLAIGATGNVGRQVILQLEDTGARIRALSRNPPTESPPRIEWVRGDLTLPATLDECLKGIDTVFLVWRAPPAAVEPALERIAKHARRIVFLSAPHKTAHPFFQQPNPVAQLHARIERAIEKWGLQWTFLRPGMLASNARLWWAQRIRAGDVIRWPYLGARTAPIHEHDIAAAAVRALCEDGHHEAEYVLTGPQSLSQAEQLRTIGSVIGRSPRIEEISAEEARRELPAFMPPPVANMLLDAWAATMDHPALITSTAADLTGAPPRTFLDWASEHAAEFQA